MTIKNIFRINLSQIFLGTAFTGIWMYLSFGTESLSIFRQVRPGYIIPMLGVLVFCIFVRFIRWQYMLRCIDVRIPTRPSLSVYCASLVGIVTPGYIGEILRSLLLKRKFQVSFHVSIWVFVMERIFDLCAIGIIGMIMPGTIEMKKSLALIMAILCAAGSVYTKLAQRTDAVRRLAKSFYSGAGLLRSIALSMLAWTSVALLLPLAASGIGMSLEYGYGMGIFSTAVVLGAISFMPVGGGSTGSIAIKQMEHIGMSYTHSADVASLALLLGGGITLFLGSVYLLIEYRGRNVIKSGVNTHFDEITHQYCHQFKDHVWNYLLDKRISLISSVLKSSSFKLSTGLDIGCGLGSQCLSMRQRGYSVIGIDFSYNLAQRAHTLGVKVINGDALMLPFQDSSFHYIYTIGALHHLRNREDQLAACSEIVRVLKPGGYLIVQETNTRNPLFRFYMGYVFPLISSIDEGTEWWIEPQRWQETPGMKLRAMKYFTFLPDFIPQFLMRPALFFEKKLEAGMLRFYSVHYMAVLQKDIH